MIHYWGQTFTRTNFVWKDTFLATGPKVVFEPGAPNDPSVQKLGAGYRWLPEQRNSIITDANGTIIGRQIIGKNGIEWLVDNPDLKGAKVFSLAGG